MSTPAQPPDSFLRLADVTFAYRRGAAAALKDVSVDLGEGVVGLVGANGAGKTTLLRLISGSLRPTSGRITVGGQDPNSFRRAGGLGALPDFPRFPDYLTVAEFLEGLRSVCAGRGVSNAERELHSSMAIQELEPRQLSELSLGQMRRVELLAAVAGDPDLVLLDEPTNGLDPLAISALRRGIAAARRPGRLLLVSSHHLDELQRVADRVLFLHRGTLAVSWDRNHPDANETSLESLFLSLEHAEEHADA